MSNDANPNEKLKKYLDIYLSPSESRTSTVDELEVRFGTEKPITQIQFDDVIAKLKSLGFSLENMAGLYRLTIQSEYTDPKSGYTKISSIRTELSGLANIQEYCKKNTIDLDANSRIVQDAIFVQKNRKSVNGTILQSIDFDDFGFRVNYKTESKRNRRSNVIGKMISEWNESKKIFRLIKRFTFTHENYPLKIDCSIVRSSKKNRRRLIPEYRIETSNVFNNPESYEIEVELMTHDFPVSMGTHVSDPEFSDTSNVLKLLKRTIKSVLSGLQNSNFPISSKVEQSVIRNYMNMLHKGNPPSRWVGSRDFVGFSSISLEIPNISAVNEESDVANIRNSYTVTEKADGIRKMLYINKDGKVYFIDVNMNVQFTGVIAENQDYHESLIDGEHVLHDKYGAFINYYLAFDAYYIGREDIRNQPLANGASEEVFKKTRIVSLHDIVTKSNFQPILGKKIPLAIKEKTFYVSNSSNIFKNCNIILSNEADGLFEYETDGLIFTPANTGIGSKTVGEVLPPTKMTWKDSFKWKPPEFNSIDFLVTTKKTESGGDFVGNIFEDGSNFQNNVQLTQYKTLILRVGFSERDHGYLNPCEDVIQGHLPAKNSRDDRSKYKPVPFYPTDPTPKYPGYLCNIVLEETNGVNYMLTEDRADSFEDGTIVEFKYQKSNEKGYQWIPIRVRKKKTAEYRAGKNNFGNAYHVANSIWRSIHNPVTEDMIRSGANIPSQLVEDEVYYNRKSGSTITRAMRDFHNLFVKRILIMSVANRGDTLIDMTVGKGGDFPKWIAAKLSFVFGLDVSRDNIQNRLDGACARLLNYKKKWKNMPLALFVTANSGLNIRGRGEGEDCPACFTDKGKQITKAIFGEGPKDEALLGAGVYKQYGKGKDGFNIVSNQFSIHYFFKDKIMLNGFLRNVSECCKVGGYFIGSSYDGTKVFRALEKKEPGESIKIMVGERKMWEVVKQYDSDDFDNNESCLGYQIDVYQESINKVFPEYLVNYDYLTHLLGLYGFALLTVVECQELGIPTSLGNVDLLFKEMQHRIKSKQLRKADIGTALNMTSDEKRVSFLNKFFVFKKIRDVNAGAVEKIQLNLNKAQQKQVSETNKALGEIVKGAKPAVKKLGKLKLKKTVKVPKLKVKLPKFTIKK
jgi:hypothetical protein